MPRLPSLALTSRTVWAYLFVPGFLLAAWWLAGVVVRGGGTELTYALLLVGGAAIALVILTDWRAGFYLFIVWLVFEDLARKFLGNNMYIYFGKDVLVAVTLFALAFSTRGRRGEFFRPPFLGPLLLFVGLGVIQVFNPSSPSFLYGLLGLKLYFYYIPLLFVGFSLIRSEKDLQTLLNLNLGLASLVALGGIAQAVIGPDILNPPELAPELQVLGRLQRVAPLSGITHIRPTSVFVSDGRFAWYLLLMWLLAFAAIAYGMLREKRRGLTLALVALGLLSAAILLSGVRATVLYALASGFVLGAAFLRGSPLRTRSGLKLAKGLQLALVMAGVGLLLVIGIYPEEVGARWAFYSETLSPMSSASELAYRSWDYPLRNLAQVFEFQGWYMGFGIGTSSLGVQYVSKFLNVPPPAVGVESGLGTLILELGTLGPLLWFLWVGVFLRSAWRLVRGLRGTSLYPLAVTIAWFAFLLTVVFTYYGFQAYQNFIYNAFLWLLLGILYRLPKLAETAASEAPSAQAAAHAG